MIWFYSITGVVAWLFLGWVGSHIGYNYWKHQRTKHDFPEAWKWTKSDELIARFLILCGPMNLLGVILAYKLGSCSYCIETKDVRSIFGKDKREV